MFLADAFFSENENAIPKDVDVKVPENVKILSAIEIDMDDLSGEETLVAFF